MDDSNHKTHVTETPDVSHIKNVEVTHEVSDVHISGIARFVLGLFVLMVASFFLMWALFRAFESKTKDTPASPMALSEKDRLPPEPRLQGAPGFGEKLEKEEGAKESAEPKASPTPKDALWEIKALRERWNDVLAHGPVDQTGKRYGMPIEKAKEEILKQGLPVRKQ